jgi:hypothetical protein
MWMNDSGCEETIQGIWNQNLKGTTMYKVATKLKDYKKKKNWGFGVEDVLAASGDS